MPGPLKWLAGIGGKVFSFVAVMASLTGAHAMVQERLTAIKSNYGRKETMDRLEAEVTSKGLTVRLQLPGPLTSAGAAANGAAANPELLKLRLSGC